MKILIWVNQFPSFSETFIRDQIIHLKKNGNEIKIFCNIKFDKEYSSLKGFEKYNLFDDIVFKEDFVIKNKVNRYLNSIFILLGSIYSKNILIYLRSLNFFKYGNNSLNLNLFYFSNYLLKNKIKIIHAHFGDNGNRASIFKELGLPIKLFTTFHGYDIRQGLNEGGVIYSKLFKHVDKIFCISNYNKNNLVLFGAPLHKMVNLPNGIETTFFSRSLELKIEDKIKILSVARLVQEKGLVYFLNALKILILKYPNLEFEYTIVGDGVLKPKLKEFIKANKLDENVNLVGSKNSRDVRDFLIKSDVFVLSSIAEAYPTVLLEAQSCSLPIIATNVGSVKDMLPQSIVVEPSSVSGLVNGFVEYLENRKYWIDIAEELRKNVYEKHDIAMISSKLISYYELP